MARKTRGAFDAVLVALEWLPHVIMYAFALLCVWLIYPVVRAWREVRLPDKTSEDSYITFDEPQPGDADYTDGSLIRRRNGAAADGNAVMKGASKNKSLYRKRRFPSLQDASSVTLSLIVPAYNEERRLPKMLDETIGYLDNRTRREKKFTYEIIIVDDGSRDK